jgi:hypothetical protein
VEGLTAQLMVPSCLDFNLSVTTDKLVSIGNSCNLLCFPFLVYKMDLIIMHGVVPGMWYTLNKYLPLLPVKPGTQNPRSE